MNTRPNSTSMCPWASLTAFARSFPVVARLARLLAHVGKRLAAGARRKPRLDLGPSAEVELGDYQSRRHAGDIEIYNGEAVTHEVLALRQRRIEHPQRRVQRRRGTLDACWVRLALGRHPRVLDQGYNVVLELS